MASLNQDDQGGESSIPTSIMANENIRSVHTIGSSTSFDSSEHVSVDTDLPTLAATSQKADPMMRVSPNSLKIHRTVSDTSLSNRVRRTNSVESFASGELVVSELVIAESSESSEKVPKTASFDSITSSFDDEIKLDSSEEEVSEEDDTEVFLAEAMALAIAKNPNMTPTQLRELQQQVQEQVEQKRKQMAIEKAKKKKKKKISTKRIQQEMKAAYKETKNNAKKAMKQIESNSKASATHIRNEAKKGLRAAGLMKPSSSDDVASIATEQTSNAVEPASNHTVDSDRAGSPPDVDEDTVRLAGVIWKRRSGLGKYSMTAPWERRRVVLQGSRLIYYKTLQESSEGEDEEEHSNSENENPGLLYNSAGTFDDASAWINSMMDKAGVTMPWEVSSSSTHRGARGYLDLRKERASASASYGHTGAPTPFALSIKVASTGTTKYKFCFDTQQELMQWLSAITDVVVAGSVDSYNAEILQVNDPSAHGDTLSGIANSTGMVWQEPSPRNAMDASAEGRGKQLWATERYQVASDDNFVKAANAQIQRRSMANAPAPSTEPEEIIGSRSEDYMVDKSAGDDFVAIPANYMEPAIYLINAVILVARAETTLSNEVFWYMLVFFNLLGVFMVSKVQVGGTIKIKPELESRVGQKVKKTKVVDGALATIQSVDSSDTAPSLVDENFVPPAGSTSMKIENPTDVPTKDGHVFPGWRAVEASDLMVRGVGYKVSKTKVPCPQSLYECVDLDIFESKARVPDMAGRVILPKVDFGDSDRPKTWSAPDIFVITVALPTDPPKLYGGSTDNGGGYTLTMYCVMRQETRDILRRVTAETYNPAEDQNPSDPNKSMVNAVKLFDEWCRRAPSDDNWMARFKVVPQGNNLAEIGLPSWISNYNGKPFLIKRPGTTGFLYRHPDKSCMEFDVSLHPFPYLAKQGICYMKDGFFKKILATLAFCIEGRSDDELPECLIGLFQIVSLLWLYDWLDSLSDSRSSQLI